VIVIAGTVRVQPARREDALRVARAMAQATCAEAGCRHYRFYADVDDPGTFFLFEEWESEAALARHFESDHMRTFQQEIPALLAAPPQIRRYEVESTRMMTG
jgi:quinol monooxygenase YgiN